ncbi:MAG: alpha/beta fold hydrolase, partial [Phycisphaerales bacterium]|nr:alpha/beta fold hydrolase [Phycisphaerales bacterium]
MLLIYVALLLCSRVVEFATANRTPPSGPGATIELVVAAVGDPGKPRTCRVHLLEWGPTRSDLTPVILLHGSPGSADNFSRLGPMLAASGRSVMAVELPGFGFSTGSVVDYSIREHASTVLALMDERSIDRAHVLGWSMGGGVVLGMADLEPNRLASITMLSAIGAQETEGSGNYFFEHAKYAVGLAVVGVLDLGVPHFGLIDFTGARSFLRNFWDTDQRPLRVVMERLDTPVLILHGRHDPLVADWAAERHHELIPTSRLVLTPHSHFMPLLQPEETAGHLEPFFARHDTPGVEPDTGTLDLAPRPDRTGFGGVFDGALTLVRDTPWWMMAIVFAVLARLRRETATALAGIFVGHTVLDFGAVFVGLLIGRALHPREPWLNKDKRWLAGLPVWTGLSLLIAQLLSGHGSPVDTLGLPGFIALIALVAITLNAVKLAPTRVGRRRIIANIRRLTHHEWWPTWFFYIVFSPHFVRLALRHRSALCWTCVNPGIQPGGGVMGESKHDILRGFSDAQHLAQISFEPHETDRAEKACERVESDPSLGGYPVIVKPDVGERGSGVVVARSPGALTAAVDSTPGRVLVQRYHPGPVECGVFWVRDVRTVGDESADEPQGRIFA